MPVQTSGLLHFVRRVVFVGQPLGRFVWTTEARCLKRCYFFIAAKGRRGNAKRYDNQFPLRYTRWNSDVWLSHISSQGSRYEDWHKSPRTGQLQKKSTVSINGETNNNTNDIGNTGINVCWQFDIWFRSVPKKFTADWSAAILFPVNPVFVHPWAKERTFASVYNN